MVKEWDTAKIGDILDFKNGLNKGKDYFGQGTPIVNYTDVYKHRGLRLENIKGLVSLDRNEIKRYEVKKGDVFFTRTSETPEEVGIASVMLEDIEDCVFSGFVLRGRPKNDMLIPEYCKYCFSTPHVRQEIISNCTYTIRALTNGKQLSRIEIPIPEKEEQCRIAQAISDIDELIFNLEKLIIKKKNIREGAMQELLTGTACEFADIKIDIKKGQTITKSHVKEGKYPVIAGGKTAAYYCNLFNRDGITITVSASGASAGYVSLHNGRIFASDCSTIGESENYNVIYIYYLLLSIQKQIYESQSGGAQPHIHPKDINHLYVKYINDINIQNKISAILTDIDCEIEYLQSKLEKYRKIKSGMMDELLTGKVRLV